MTEKDFKIAAKIINNKLNNTHNSIECALMVDFAIEFFRNYSDFEEDYFIRLSGIRKDLLNKSFAERNF